MCMVYRRAIMVFASGEGRKGGESRGLRAQTVPIAQRVTLNRNTHKENRTKCAETNVSGVLASRCS